MPGLMGTGVLVNWGGVVADQEDDYNMWHSREHMPERLAVPGFRRGRRGVAIDAPIEQKYFMMYEVATPEVLVSAPYLARLDDPTPWTRAILSAYIAPSRTVCRVLASKGHGVAGWLATLQISGADRATARALACGAWIADTMQRNGILAAHAIEGDPELGQQPTAEKRFRESRGVRDRTVDFALLVDAFDRGPGEDALVRLASLVVRELGVTPIGGLYRTQHVITNADVGR